MPPVIRPPQPLECGPAAVEVRIGDQSGRAVALTFDAGADRGYTGQILDILAQEGVPAAFGITGAWAEENPDLVSAIAAGGHLLMNHSYDHPSFTGLSTGLPPLSREERLDQLQHADAVIRSTSGAGTRPFFRPPFGDLDQSVLCDVYAAGYTYAVNWTVDSGGWAGASSAEIAQTLLSQARPGAIIIMHVGSESEDATALPEVIGGLRAAGYELVALSQLLP
jgi:peptidoglycan/xylan/chitin deacetylase (PgdA/CDA1 family)